MQFRRNYRVMCVDVPFLPGKFQWCEPEKRLPFIETGYSWKMCLKIAQNVTDDIEYVCYLHHILGALRMNYLRVKFPCSSVTAFKVALNKL